MRHVTTKTVFGVSDQVRHKQGCTTTEDGYRLEILEEEGLYYLRYVAKTKAPISCLVAAQLICAFDFAYAKSRFSHDAAHIIFTVNNKRAEQTAQMRGLTNAFVACICIKLAFPY